MNFSAADLIETQAAEIEKLKAQVPRWIPVEEMIPPDQEEVLVLTRSKNGVRNVDKGYWAIDLPAVRVKMNNEVNDIIPVYTRRMVTAPPVRCKDCRHSYEDIGGLTCSHGICVDCIVREDFFCADGVKREVADD